jgi:hypothetical protein
MGIDIDAGVPSIFYVVISDNIVPDIADRTVSRIKSDGFMGAAKEAISFNQIITGIAVELDDVLGMICGMKLAIQDFVVIALPPRIAIIPHPDSSPRISLHVAEITILNNIMFTPERRPHHYPFSDRVNEPKTIYFDITFPPQVGAVGSILNIYDFGLVSSISDIIPGRAGIRRGDIRAISSSPHINCISCAERGICFADRPPRRRKT